MTSAGWDEILDDIEHALDVVEEALAAGDTVPELPPFDPPSDVLPPLRGRQRRRAEALMRRQTDTTRLVTAQIVTTQVDLRELRRRRRAALAYVRGG